MDWGDTMAGLAGIDIYNDIRVLALVPALSVIADYTLTFVFAHGVTEILQYEFSPIVRTATAYGVIPLVVLCIAGLYYLLSYLALRMLQGTCVYPFAVAILVIVSMTHVMGGLSWLVRIPFYSYMVHGFSIMAIVLAVGGLLWGVIRCPRHLF